MNLISFIILTWPFPEWFGKGYIYEEIGEYAARGKVNQANIKLRERELSAILKERMDLDAYQIRQGKGHSIYIRTVIPKLLFCFGTVVIR
jgi:hypothetical protein